MHLDILERTKHELTISFKDTDISYVNLLRRIMISDIPSYAIEHTTIHENTSYMNSEPLSARLALVPIKCTSINEGSDSEIKLNLNVNCIDKEELSVYSRDITTSNTKLIITHPDILIMKLKEGQCIDIDMYCKLDIGKTHSKFSPVSVVDLLNRGDDVYMRIESSGQLDPFDILLKSIEKLQYRNNEMLSQLDKITS